jgi:hypothetical protein
MCAHSGSFLALFFFFPRYLTIFLLQALLLSHPFPSTRDTQQLAYKYKLSKGRRPALRNITAQEFGIQIQGGEHSSVCFILCVPRATACVFTFACRLQTPGPPWRCTVYTAASGKKERDYCCHPPMTRIAQTSLKHRRNGDVQTVKRRTSHLVAGRRG